MGEAAEAILNGEDCESCGEYIGPGDGAPRNCPACARAARAATAGVPRNTKVPCPHCGRRVRSVGLEDHIRDVHVRPKHPKEPGA